MEAKSLSCDCNCSKLRWMSSTLFHSRLSDINKKMISDDGSILLVIDNAPRHRKSVASSNVDLVWLPPTYSVASEPMVQGIILSFKCAYRRYLLEFV